MQLVYQDKPNRNELPYWMNTTEIDRGADKGFLQWGATQARGAPAAFTVAGEYSRHALPANTSGLQAYRQLDAASRAYHAPDNVDWIQPKQFYSGSYQSSSTPRSQQNTTLHL